MNRSDCSPGYLRCLAENRERSSEEGRGDIPESDAGNPGSLWPGWQLCAHWPGPTSSRDAGVSPLLCSGFLKPRQTRLPAFCPFCVGLLAFLLLTLELFMHSEYKAISDMRFASIFPRVWPVSPPLFFVEKLLTLTS